MIRITNIRMLNPHEADYSFAIVRSMRSPIKYVEQETALSPSWDLLRTYMDLKNEGKWNKEAFQSIYVPQFLREVKGNPDAIARLNWMWKRDRQGCSIEAACFCEDEDTCHRSIVAGLLQGTGCNALTQTGTDYSEYFRMFKAL